MGLRRLGKDEKGGLADTSGRMQSIGGSIKLSACDLVGHLNCRYLTELDLKVANGQLQKPKVWDPVLATLAERGALHERSYVDHLKGGGLSVTVVDGVGVDGVAVAATISAMERGDAVIVQGALEAGRWNGRADVLRRVDTPSRFGGWSYEVTDTKLARETKGNTVLQICLYSDLLAEMQATRPAMAYVVTPAADFVPVEYRIADYSAYYRHVRNSLESVPSLLRARPMHIPNPSSTATSAGGAGTATKGDELTIICRSSRE